MSEANSKSIGENMSHETAKSAQPSELALAALYQRYALDRVIEAAHLVSHDFVRRPRQYRAVPENIAEILEEFRIRTGSNPAWLSAQQRALVLGAIFGRTFQSSSTAVRAASVAFSDRGAEKSADSSQPVSQEAAVFRSWLKGVQGRAIFMADKETGHAFRSAIEVIKSKEVAGVFGLPPVTEDHWPLIEPGKENVDSFAGANLIIEIWRRLGVASARSIVTPYRFMALQRIAYYGALTIEGVLNDTGGVNHTKELVRSACGWEQALHVMVSGIDLCSFWKDVKYRQELSPFERTTMSPHPSGEGGLKGTQLDPAMAGESGGSGDSPSTITNDGICCYTDYLCRTTTSIDEQRCCSSLSCPTYTCPEEFGFGSFE